MEARVHCLGHLTETKVLNWVNIQLVHGDCRMLKGVKHINYGKPNDTLQIWKVSTIHFWWIRGWSIVY